MSDYLGKVRGKKRQNLDALLAEDAEVGDNHTGLAIDKDDSSEPVKRVLFKVARRLKNRRRRMRLRWRT